MFRRLLCDISLWSVKTDEIDGIGIADFGRPEHDFTRHMRAALAVIRRVDPRRFKRVQRLRWIANDAHYRGAGWGQYIHIARMCNIDFVLHEELSDDQVACVYAALIVHEATHCVLAQRGCRYKGEARRRDERICVREENRFCRLLEAQTSGIRRLVDPRVRSVPVGQGLEYVEARLPQGHLAASGRSLQDEQPGEGDEVGGVFFEEEGFWDRLDAFVPKPNEIPTIQFEDNPDTPVGEFLSEAQLEMYRKVFDENGEQANE